jgi:hypothetical protein
LKLKLKIQSVYTQNYHLFTPIFWAKKFWALAKLYVKKIKIEIKNIWICNLNLAIFSPEFRAGMMLVLAILHAKYN